MDEGRNMLLIFPGLVDFESEVKRRKFSAKCHMFYADRVVDVSDDLPKWAGMQDKSKLIEGRDKL